MIRTVCVWLPVCMALHIAFEVQNRIAVSQRVTKPDFSAIAHPFVRVKN
jgi:hypothetical protein